MEVISCHRASQDGPKKLSRFMREVTLARIMKNSCAGGLTTLEEPKFKLSLSMAITCYPRVGAGNDVTSLDF